jgi:hypothetical protein
VTGSTRECIQNCFAIASDFSRDSVIRIAEERNDGSGLGADSILEDR